MASTVLVRDVLYRVSVLLQDAVPQFLRQPESELVNWLNDAEAAITKYLPAACSRNDVVKLKAGTKQSIESIAAADCLPGDGTTPNQAILGNTLLDVVRNMGSNGATPGKVVRRVPRDDIDSQQPNWHTVNAAAVSTFSYDPRTPRYFYVYPGVTGTVWAEIAYTAQPLKIDNSGAIGSERYKSDGSGSGATDKITIADEFVDDLVNYVVARANMKNVTWADANKAVAFTNMFTGSLNAKVAALTGNNPNLNQLPFAPEPLAQAR